MKLEDIDHLFKNNERQFDQMPNEQVWSRLEQRLGQALVSEKTDNAATVKVVQFGKLRRFLAAAAIILVILSPVAWYLLNTSNSADKQMAVNTAAPSTANYEPTETTDSAVVNALLEEDNAVTSRSYALPDDETLSKKTTPIKQANKPSENQVFSSERKLSISEKKQPESNETNFADDSRPSTEIYAPPAMAKPAAPQPAQSVASGTAVRKENGNLQDQLSSVGKTNTVNPPLADVSYTRYYLGIDANEQPDSYAKTTTVAPIITNNSGKPYYPSQTETVKQKKQSSQKERTYDVVAPAAKDDTPIPNITLKTLSWLWGTWTGTVNNAAISEKWLPDGTGNISTTVNGNTYFSETATIKSSGKGLVYTIFNPQAGNIVTYQLSDYATANNLIFENKDNTIAYPGIIAYHLVSDNTLYVTFTGFDPNGQPLQTTLLYQRQ